MNKDIAILFTVQEFQDFELLLLLPDRVIVGNLDKKNTKFYDELSNNTYFSADNVLDSELNEVFGLAMNFQDLCKKYKDKEIISSYFSGALNNVYFYDLTQNEDKLIVLSIEDFEKEYGIKVSYDSIKNGEEKFNTSLPESDKKIVANPLTDIKYLNKNLKNKILFQDDNIDSLLLTLYKNYAISDDKSNIIICGDTGVGKTKTLKEIEKSLSVPMVFRNFSSIQYDDLDILSLNLLYSLYLKSQYNLGVAQEGIIVIDGIDEEYDLQSFNCMLDEIATSLKPILEKHSFFLSDNDGNSFEFDTSKLTIILSGKFQTLLNQKEKSTIVPIEFFNEKSKIKLTKGYTQEDFDSVYYTDIELFKYFDTIINFNNLTKDNIKEILLKSDDSLLINYSESLKKQNIVLKKIPDSVIEYICDKVYKNKMNCKGLKKEINNIFKNCLMDVMKTDDENLELKIKNDIIYNPQGGYQLKKKK